MRKKKRFEKKDFLQLANDKKKKRQIKCDKNHFKCSDDLFGSKFVSEAE